MALPTVMYGGYALVELLTKKNALTLLSAAKHLACGTFVAGILTQSGGFFIHMAKGDEDRPSIGTNITSLGTVLLTAAAAYTFFQQTTNPYRR